ncbi:hypothetical protein [Sulfitobacter aestuariivivens]|uniref:Antibiotic biosynthesis monooxygenase n=1 Tax=Sulfitobacter aestuariivivens TaxID=2766981 RepID=A0A927HF58_9RHOB|nr:hypothetical protein [Sulfitobacter aestuariivivens]MBD3664601.1 hypothetical protein [Sulfitobacter aestuariivivens]
MRGITITYSYDGDEAIWRSAIAAFITAIEADPDIAGKFVYQVAVADDGKTRIHWGRWDSTDTLTHLQSQPYFKTFASSIKDFAGGPPTATGHDVTQKTTGW